MTIHATPYVSRQTMAKMLRISKVLPIILAATPGLAGDIPACALTGSMTVTIGGRPALRLADVARCAPDLYEIIPSVQIDGQPMVHFKSGTAGKLRCITLPNPSVQAEGKPPAAVGDVACAATH